MTLLVFIALYVVVSVAALLIGVRFYRASEPKGDITVEQAKRFGRLLMMAATAMIVFLAAVWWHGDLKVAT